MSIEVKQSLLNRTGIMLATIMLLSVINIVISFLTAETAESDAVRINIAGSLRMQSYRIAEALLIQEDEQMNPGHLDLLTAEIRHFEERFYNPVLFDYLSKTPDAELANAMGIIETHWLTLKDNLLNANKSIHDKKMLLLQTDDFVLKIDNLVKKLEMQTERKFQFLRSFQGISLFITLIIVLLSVIDINSNVVVPLGKLGQMARKLQTGDFSMRLHIDSNDELSLLAQTFNNMAESLNAIYQNLEEKVREKTEYLEKAKDEISLLYATSQHLNTSTPIIERIEKTLGEVSEYFSVDNIAVDLSEDGENAFRLTSTQPKKIMDAPYIYCFDITHRNLVYGQLAVYFEKDPPLGENGRRLLQTIADNIASAYGADKRHGQERRLTLMEERTTIARELHDSLAQSLSYLKIQVARLEMQQNKGSTLDALGETTHLIKTGINAAYSQLRELLTTFRLQLPSGSLHAALLHTTEEFSRMSGLNISLDYRLANIPLTPNEEIHILHIVRESLSNVLRHSHATSADISIHIVEELQVQVQINDNGIGFGADDIKENHYGKIIIQERTNALGGKVSFINREGGGATVLLSFNPNAIKSKTDKINPTEI